VTFIDGVKIIIVYLLKNSYCYSSHSSSSLCSRAGQKGTECSNSCPNL